MKDNIYEETFRIGRACGRTDKEIWDTIHEVWDNHKIEWRHRDMLRNKDVRRKPKHKVGFYRLLSKETVSAIFRWIKENKITQAKAAEENNLPHNVFTRLRDSRKMQPSRDVYKNLKKFCEKNNILWKDEVWEEKE